MPETPLKLIMLGTKNFALPTFNRLAESGHQMLALVTQPDRPQGRKQELIPSQIKQSALARGIPVYQPEDVNGAQSLAWFREQGPDLIVTAAYGQILSGELLGVPRLGGINLHGSILPAYRGASPVARAIQNGDTESGVTVIRMTPKIDAGGMIAFARTAIGPEETAGELEGRLAELGAPLIAECVDRLADGEVEILPQDQSRVTRAPKLRKEEGDIDWSKSAEAITRLVRAMNPWPLSRTYWHPGESGRRRVMLLVYAARPVAGSGEPGRVIAAGAGGLVVAAGTGDVELVTVQPVGKRPMPAVEFLKGNRVAVGDRFGGA
jgi:methionyl-tRNA formyltransferase